MEATNFSLVPEDLLKKALAGKMGEYLESIMIMDTCKKFNRMGIAQDRVVVLSKGCFFLFGSNGKYTGFLIRDLKYVVLAQNSSEVILCFAEKKETTELRL